ncbi:methyltransferase domain-containing protein [Nordella sp. HKS 07]|uniref:class I SAM-dependent methyltransferase n=1 Tax=Nordella sp. HKS 07 TaxID=2712222 RepID=UPI0013E15DF0|nr:methyltransferase domain-containing protein [Nordella sp. HKS 07]QIG46685.1 methyltransferase domain-containing protein [Nordella sp. HKS 07]
MKRSDLLFWRRYLRRPLGVGAVVPSGPSLAKAMVTTLAPGPEDIVVEIGPGTGPFTRALLAAGVSPSRLILVEFDKEFVRHLRQNFPGVTVLHGDAQELPRLLKEHGHEKVPCILSGLPLRSMPEAIRTGITRAMAASLADGGKLVQFSYFREPPLAEAEVRAAGLTARRARTIMANVPPAFVWRYGRES